jgi:PAS domain S-box-containing protein
MDSDILYRSIFENTGTAMVIIEDNTIISLTNEEFVRLSGYSKDEIEGKKSWTDFVVKEDLEWMKEQHNLRRTEPSAASRDYEFQFADRHGKIKNIHLTIDIIPGTSRSIAALLDITEHKRAEQNIIDWKNRYELVIAASGQLVYDYDVSTGAIVWGGDLRRILGMSDEEMNGGFAQWASMIHPDDRDEALRLIDVSQKSLTAYDTEYRFRHSDGSYRWIHDRGYFLENVSGKATRMIGMMSDIGNRKLTEEVNTLLAQTLKSVRDSISITHLDDTILFVNEAFLATYGYTLVELLGKKISIVRGSHVSQQIGEELFRKTQVDGWHGELLNRRKDGSEFPIELWTSLVNDSSGKPIATVGVARDITERKRAEVLQNAVYRISQAFDRASNLDDLYGSVHEIIGTVMPAKNFYISLYDSKNDLISFPYFIDEVDVRPSSVKPRKGLTEYVLRTGQPLLCDEATDARLRASGKVDLIGAPSAIWLGVPLILDEKPVGVMVVQHYTDAKAYGERELHMLEYVSSQVAKAIWRKQEEERNRQSEERFRLISENVADLIAVLDLEGKRVYNSPSYKGILGGTEMLKGTDSFGEIHPEDRERIKNIFFETVRTGIGQRTEYRYLRKDGTIRYIESQGSAIKDNDGKVSNVIFVSRDITERKNLDEQLLRSQRMESIGTLAGGIAHDLNNVLAPILLAVEVLKKSVPDESSLKILETLERSVNRGGEIVKQVLGFARGIEGERTVLQIRHIIKEMISIAGETFPRSIVVKEDIPKECWTTLGDATQLHQLLMNLCLNARDAMPQSGTLTISAKNEIIDEQYARMHIDAKPGRYLMLSVQDTGTGIPPEIVNRIFEPFFTTKEVGRGTGLGLATVHTIVKSHGGFINVYSELGNGTTIKVYLPAADTAETKTLGRENRELLTGHGELILVVDDEASICQITKQTLEAFGYRAITASDGTEAVAHYASHGKDIAVVLTDMMMPVMDGPRTILALRKLNPMVKIIASSGLMSDGHAMAAANVGVNALITKPYTADKLLKAIHQVLHGKTR